MIKDFILSLLEQNSDAIIWVNKSENFFRFIKCDKVAFLWGCTKKDPEKNKMNYEKMSRALRYLYVTTTE